MLLTHPLKSRRICTPDVKAHLRLELNSASIQQVRLDQELLAPALRTSQECGLCKQEIFAQRQASLNLILIEGYGFCPNCGQNVRREISSTSWYRRRWRERVRAISKKMGWGWERETNA